MDTISRLAAKAGTLAVQCLMKKENGARKDIQEKINVVQAKGDILKTLTTTSYFYKTTLNSI